MPIQAPNVAGGLASLVEVSGRSGFGAGMRQGQERATKEKYDSAKLLREAAESKATISLAEANAAKANQARISDFEKNRREMSAEERAAADDRITKSAKILGAVAQAEKQGQDVPLAELQKAFTSVGLNPPKAMPKAAERALVIGLGQKIQENITLSQGQQVVSPTGTTIASVAAKPEAPTNTKTMVNPKTGEKREVRIGDQNLDVLMGQGWIEAPSRQETGGAGAFDATGKVSSEVQIGILDAETMLDSLHQLTGEINKSPGGQTYWGNMAKSMLTVGAKLGVDYTGSIAEFRSSKQKIVNYTKKVQDAYRRIITGSQANKYELERIEDQMPNENDDLATIKNKIATWQDEAERINVRYRMVLNKGFTFSGRDPDGAPLYTDKQGRTVEISAIESLGNIMPHKEKRDQITADIAKRYPSMPLEKQHEAVFNEMAKQGYNTRIYRSRN